MEGIKYSNTVCATGILFFKLSNFYTPLPLLPSFFPPEGEIGSNLFNPNDIFPPYIDELCFFFSPPLFFSFSFFRTVTLGNRFRFIRCYAYYVFFSSSLHFSPTNIEQYKINVPQFAALSLPLFSELSLEIIGAVFFSPSFFFFPLFYTQVNPLYQANWKEIVTFFPLPPSPPRS